MCPLILYINILTTSILMIAEKAKTLVRFIMYTNSKDNPKQHPGSNATAVYILNRDTDFVAEMFCHVSPQERAVIEKFIINYCCTSAR